MSEILRVVTYDEPRKANVKINAVLWIVQTLLAVLFSMAGYLKAFQPLDVLAQSIFWVPYVPPALVRFIGVSELLGGIGLIVPALTSIRPRLTLLAALGLTVVMLCASIFHILRGEFFALPMTAALFALAAFVTYGRWRLAPFSS